MYFESYLTPSPSSVKFRPDRRSNITSQPSLNRETSRNSSSTSNRTMGIVDHEENSSRIASAACDPPQGCDKDSLWWALVSVASQRYDEMKAEEAQSKSVEQVEEPVAQVVQGQDQDDEEDGDERLVIDEATTSDDHQEQPEPTASTSTDNSGNYEVSVRYNANMARKFPGAEGRTPEQQAVRQRNTVAARQSRAKMRIMEDMLNTEAFDERKMNVYMKERVSVSCMYGNRLRELLNMDEADFWAEFQKVKDQYVVEPLRSQHVVPRNISDESFSDYQGYSDEDSEDDEDEEEEQQPGTSADTVGNRKG